ncbi:kinase-like domain-containing protein [Rhizophagus clarus]|uniref:Kinase-like domain-containing protein n=1 Tax=Rhizophagus clarus TaxID=94130 RepID=A0A8H3QJT5_9GLOM|nr:kinase-like domain-containing protein [Rhizophagus clarus]
MVNIIGLTKLESEERYSLVLEYAEGGTLRDYLRNNIIEWKNQLKFAREITKCLEQEPDERPNISEVNETFISWIDSENNNVFTVPYSKGSEESKKIEF